MTLRFVEAFVFCSANFLTQPTGFRPRPHRRRSLAAAGRRWPRQGARRRLQGALVHLDVHDGCSALRQRRGNLRSLICRSDLDLYIFCPLDL